MNFIKMISITCFFLLIAVVVAFDLTVYNNSSEYYRGDHTGLIEGDNLILHDKILRSAIIIIVLQFQTEMESLISSHLIVEGKATLNAISTRNETSDVCIKPRGCVIEVDLSTLKYGDTVDITPHEAVRRIGDELSVLCKVSYPIDSCRMTVGTTSYRLIPENVQGDIVYAGRGLREGECGALIKNIKEEWNGNVTCVLPPKLGWIELIGTMRLLVAVPPGEPVLYSSEQSTFMDGDKFMVQCAVPNGRPAAKITWFLGTEELFHGKQQPIVTSELGSDLQTISQNVSWMLSDDDDTKILICRAEHETLEHPKEVRRQLIVQYPPKRQETGTITIFGLKLGAEGHMNVTVRANPEPIAEWTVGDQVLMAPGRTDDGVFTAIEPLLLGSGYYNIMLIVARIAKEDLERTYYLRVDNGLGREEFAVRISTMDGPAVAANNNNTTIIISAVSASVLALLVVMYVFKRRRQSETNRRERFQRPLPQIPRQHSLSEPHPTIPFYQNMLFRRECEREIQAREEAHYEEIMYQ